MGVFELDCLKPAGCFCLLRPFSSPLSEFGIEITEETWECDNGRSTCSSSTDSCSSEGSQTSTSGTSYYAADGSFESAVGGGWDCRQIHRYHLLNQFFYQLKFDKV